MEKLISNMQTELEELKTSNLIKNYNLDKTDIKFPKIEIETLEKEKIYIELGDGYCYKVKKNNKLYESFESLLTDLSPLYTKEFWSNITSNIGKKSLNKSDDEYNEDNE